jgi:uncharacterized membrane protein YeaQ/YmgE (transglycosylase-associated protein family)
MFLLHVVAISGGAGWGTGITLFLVTAALGGLFAWLAGEAETPAPLLADLALSASGGAAANLIARPFGTDLVAYLYGVRLLCAVAGAIVVLVVAHDLTAWLARRLPARRSVITGVGGAGYLFTWLSGWPFDPGGLEATYGDGLRLKLVDGALHYEVRKGPFIGSETVLIERETAAADRDGNLHVSAPASGGAARGPSLVLAAVRPPERLQELTAAIAQLAQAAPTSDER